MYLPKPLVKMSYETRPPGGIGEERRGDVVFLALEYVLENSLGHLEDTLRDWQEHIVSALYATLASADYMDGLRVYQPATHPHRR